MKYLLNVPLALAALFQAIFASLALMSGPWPGWQDGPSRGAMAFIMIEVALAAWLPLLVAALGAVFTDAFDWSPVAHRRRRRAAMSAATLIVAAAIASSMFVAIGTSAAVGGDDFAPYGRLPAVIATIGGTIAPLVVIAWLFWLIDAPLPRRHAAWPRRIALAALALTAPGFIIGVDGLRQEIVAEKKLAASYRQEEKKNEAERAAYFANLTDASPLSSWGGFATDDIQPKERRDAALTRLAKRRTLEADLATDLVSRNKYDAFARDSDIAFLLVARVNFAPSASLEAPLRAAMSRIAAEMRKTSFGDKWTGDSDILDSYIRTEYAERLAASLIIAKRMADAGVDLRDALGELQTAANAAYPKTRTAETYRRDVAAADKTIAAGLAAHAGSK